MEILSNEFKRYREQQDANNIRIASLTTNLKNEHSVIKEKLDLLDKRIEVLEQQVGNTEKN
jgi:hypothetical protein